MTAPKTSAFAARRHWRRVLAAEIDDSALSTPAKRSARGSGARGALPLVLDGSSVRGIDTLAGGDPVMRFAVLVAAVQVMIRAHTGGRRICVGTPALAGEADAPERLLPVVVEMDPGCSFTMLAERVRQALSDAWTYQIVDPIEMRDELRPGSPPDCDPYLDVAVRLDGLLGPIRAGQHDIELDFIWEGDTCSGVLRYCAALWARPAVEALLARFQSLLGLSLANPDLAIGALPAVTESEEAALLSHGSGPLRAFDGPETLHEMVLSQCRSSPDAVAIFEFAEGEAVPVRTFDELAHNAHRIAQRLIAAGVEAEDVVGICLNRGPGLVEAMLAVMIAGGAWLPLDPDGPPRRLAAMLRQTGARLVIASGEADPEICESVDVFDIAGAAGGAEDLPQISGEHLAYVLFTSGSTGTPKGVAVPHAGVANYLRWCAATYPLGPNTMAPLHGPVDADLTITSIWGPLVCGGALLLVPEASGIEPLAQVLSSEVPLGMVKLTPTHMAALSYGDSGSSGSVPPRCLVIGGETFRASMAELWQRYDAPDAIYNEYGPTETVVGCTAWRLPSQASGTGAVPIGAPIDNACAYVVNADMQLCPPGAVGELYVGGIGVSRGYVGMPAATAMRFVPDPFSDRPGARLYRTGDLAYCLDDGVLHCLGRVDDQVKIRGVRVEPAEVESVLHRIDTVAEAVVLTHETRSRTELVAYLVFSGAAGPLSAIRRVLREALPEQMHPAHMVVVDAIPRMANGKLDRAALPLPGRQGAAAENGKADDQPEGEVEVILAEVWQRVLDLGRVGRHDNFFELGGDSILSVHVVAEARARGLHLLLSDLFEHPTLALLAPRARVEQARVAAKTPVDQDLALLPIQRWWLDQEPQRIDQFCQSLLLSLPSDTETGALEAALAALVEHHEPLRAAFARGAGGWHARLKPDVPRPALSEVDLSSLPKEAHDRAMADAAAEARRALDVGRGALVSAVRFRGGGRDSLLLVVHHLVCDPASWLVLVDDLARAVARIAAGLPPALAPASLTPWEWADRLNQHVETPGFAETAAGPLEVVAAPPAGHGTGDVSGSLHADLSRRLMSAVPAAYPVRPDEVLLAAAARVLGRWSTAGLVRIDREVHGRHAADTDVDFSRAIGWFGTLTSCWLQASAPPDALLADVREAVRAVKDGQAPSMDPSVRDFVRNRSSGFAFNHLGRIGGGGGDGESRAFAPIEAPRGVLHGADEELPFRIVIETFLAGDALRYRLRYRDLDAAVAQDLARDFCAEIDELVDHCLTVGQPHYRPSDFDLADLDQGALDRVVAAVAGESGPGDLPPGS
ncbi:MAG: amino acid adenylation domain-containing protein [Pseudomonadota bacterium]